MTGRGCEVNRWLQAITQSTSLGLLTGVALPLIARDEVLGIIYIFRAYPAAFTANDRALLASFADQAAIAVYNARLYQQVTQEKRRLDAILDSSADGILIMGPDHHIQRFNRALSRLTTMVASGLSTWFGVLLSAALFLVVSAIASAT